MNYRLGIDLGARSLGWAVIRYAGETPQEIIDCGVRCFEAGVEGDIKAGKDASRAADRRLKRGARRQTWRRARRLRKVFNALRGCGLLPVNANSSPTDRHEVLTNLDVQLRAELVSGGDHLKEQQWLYALRGQALEAPVSPLAVGRLLYHLAQRRGFLSNRRTENTSDDKRSDAKSDDDQDSISPRDIKRNIAKLDLDRGDQTLGQYFAKHDPFVRRIRQRWLGRSQIRDEFDQIREAQQHHHPQVTSDAWDRIKRAIFDQRPLKSSKGLIGKCELIPGKRRAPAALEIAQQFRILQSVNHLRMILPDNSTVRLNENQRTQLIAALNDSDQLTFAQIKKLPGMPKKAKFSLEQGSDKALKGNRTRAKLRPIFGERWDKMTPDERDQITLEVLYFQKEDALIRRAMKAWKLSRTQAEELSAETLEPGYSSHCRRALTRLVELMAPSPGLSYTEARIAAFPQSQSVKPVCDLLPPVLKAVPQLRNPAVCRALTELRTVVNCLIRKFGKPDAIHIELARDLKKGRKERKNAVEKNNDQRKVREQAVQRILAELPDLFRSPDEISRSAIQKVLLANECNWTCPFTNSETEATIDMRSLLGPHPKFDIAHIYPRRYLDDSFVNLTLCEANENRHRMGDMTPFEAYGQSPQWAEIIGRVMDFKGPAAAEKLRRFQAQEVPSDFASRQLNDTRYNSVLAAEFLGLLYGGRWDESGRRRIIPIAGGITAQVRQAWQLNRILGFGNEKNRQDHRQHAIDAVVLALTGQELVNKLQSSAARGIPRDGRIVLDEFEVPWHAFQQQCETKIKQILVSHRLDRRLQGPLHNETIYSLKTSAALKQEVQKAGKGTKKKPAEQNHVRKALVKLSDSEILGDKIVDPMIRKIVQTKFSELGGKDAKKVFAAVENHPNLRAKDGRLIPIHRVRVRSDKKTMPVGSGISERLVVSGGNHHTEIIAELDASGNEIRWTDVVVTRLDACKRYRDDRKQGTRTIVQTEREPNRKLKMSLMPKDVVELSADHGGRAFYRILSISEGDIEFRELWDGRQDNEIKAAGERGKYRTQSIDAFRKRGAVKCKISPIGEVAVDPT